MMTQEKPTTREDITHIAGDMKRGFMTTTDVSKMALATVEINYTGRYAAPFPVTRI